MQIHIRLNTQKKEKKINESFTINYMETGILLKTE